MTLVAYMPDGMRQAGYLLYQGLTDSGQFNVYESFQADVGTFINAATAGLQLGAGNIKYYATVQITSFDSTLVSSFAGFPPRFRFGSFQWLQGASTCVGPRQFIDAVSWSEDKTRETWLLADADIQGGFPPSTPDLPVEFDRINILSEYNSSSQKDYSGGVWADGFSFYLEPSVEASIAILYRCERVVISYSSGGQVYLVNI